MFDKARNLRRHEADLKKLEAKRSDAVVAQSWNDLGIIKYDVQRAFLRALSELHGRSVRRIVPEDRVSDWLPDPNDSVCAAEFIMSIEESLNIRYPESKNIMLMTFAEVAADVNARIAGQ